jgi:uncharacterized membrane-anchored protein
MGHSTEQNNFYLISHEKSKFTILSDKKNASLETKKDKENETKNYALADAQNMCKTRIHSNPYLVQNLYTFLD